MIARTLSPGLHNEKNIKIVALGGGHGLAASLSAHAYPVSSGRLMASLCYSR